MLEVNSNLGVMIPISDADRRPFRFPIITGLLIGLNFVVFLIELSLGVPFIMRWSLVPARITSGYGYATLITAMFLHGGWLHIIGNMIYLWAFGPEIEDAMGRVKYLSFYLLGGLAAFGAQIGMAPHSMVPNLGASGAIAAVMGAFLVTYPRDRIRTVLIIFLFVTIAFIPAAVLVVFWFILQLFNQVGALVSKQAGGVAYAAHIGGFLFGVIFARIFELRRRNGVAPPPRYPDYPPENGQGW